MSEYIEFRAYVGPQWLPDTSAYFHNWSTINAGGTDNFAYSTTVLGKSLTFVSLAQEQCLVSRV